MMNLEGKVALVTGGNGGIGLAMASALADAGATLAIVGRSPDKNAAAVAALARPGAPEPVAIVGDMTDEESVAETLAEVVRRFGGLDILLNNAGSNDRKLPQDYSLAEWNRLISSNLTSAFLVSQAAYPLMVARGGGKIVNIGSLMSVFGSPKSAPYAAAKGGVVQLTKSLATAWAGDNIQVNALLPGWIDTDMTVMAREQVSDLNERVLSRTPAGRWGRPEDLAGAALFLCSGASDFVTGIGLPVDGGYSCSA
ncbi:2-deoxy-D-gluconate 3-dehydrogenase [Pseudooceanicola antarcticus]|uniref:2-deoxy-D-gluconate 3-dehydrogenase n=1 Tax=Pseudooceanicola antarcticus TaxID=1247613 RepID=A0A285JE67_9RHOB|nr:glucose 1-dehydrogenase [Pseudooceanicola antarcticus]PJE31095.1 3-oxoacyl-ACP reductase [Pseudooceanicola antarcticus]SNY58562.1 2-deoxy-D-gluconate 3-dehydrogenase [Pseudooceanicola antarcticus]